MGKQFAGLLAVASILASATIGSLVFNTAVGIGLTVSGTTSTTALCIGAVCRTTWPTAGGTNFWSHYPNGTFGEYIAPATSTESVSSTNMFAVNSTSTVLSFVHGSSTGDLFAKSGGFTNAYVTGNFVGNTMTLTDLLSGVTATFTSATSSISLDTLRLGVTGNALVSGTLGVTGLSTLGLVSMGSATSSGSIEATTLLKAASGIITGASFTVNGQSVCLADGTSCPASGASVIPQFTSVVDTSGGVSTSTLTVALSGGLTAPTGTITVVTTTNLQIVTSVFPTVPGTPSIGSAARYFAETYATRTFMGIGSAAAPSFSFSHNKDTGLYSNGFDQVGISVGGTERFAFDTTAGYFSVKALAVSAVDIGDNSTGRFGNAYINNLYASGTASQLSDIYFTKTTGTHGYFSGTLNAVSLLVGGTTVCLSNGTNCPAASSVLAGVVELATAAETSTGTDDTRAVTPDGLAGSVYGKKSVSLMIATSTATFLTTTAADEICFIVPSAMNGMNLTRAHAVHRTVGASGTSTQVQIVNVSQAANMLTRMIHIDPGETSSTAAVTQPVIDTGNDDVATDDMLCPDVTAVETTPGKGTIVILDFNLP